MFNVLFAYKPPNLTSFEFLRIIQKRLFRKFKKKIKIGHTGTLDKFAEGFMILLLGKSTVFANEFLKMDKKYKAEIQIGKFTDTFDPSGKILQEWRKDQISNYIYCFETEIRKSFEEMVSQKEQIPPEFSAIKIKGKRSSDLVRKGIKVSLKPRPIQIYQVNVEDINSEGRIYVFFHVSSGTYIRAIVRDVGIKLGIPLYLDSLKRVAIGKWNLDTEKIYYLDKSQFHFYKITELLEWDCLDIEKIAEDLNLSEKILKKYLLEGKKFYINWLEEIQSENFFIVEKSENILAWLKKDSKGQFIYKKVFTGLNFEKNLHN